MASDERKKAKEDGKALRQAVTASRVDLEAELKQSRAECREGSRAALEVADTVFIAGVHDLRATRRGDKREIRGKCAVDVILADVARATDQNDLSILAPYARRAAPPFTAKRSAEQQRDDQRSQRRMIESADRAIKRKEKPKSTGAERHQEREEETLNDIPAEYHALYRSVGRRMPAPRNQSRAEQFMGWIHEHPEAIYEHADEVEREVDREMERDQAEHFNHANTVENFGDVEEPHSHKRRPAAAPKGHQAKPKPRATKPHAGHAARGQERQQAEHFSHANTHEAFEDEEPSYLRLKAAPTTQEAALEAFFDEDADPDADGWVPDPEDEEAPPARGLALWRPQDVDAEEPRGRAASGRATREDRGRSPETSAAPAETRDARRVVIREASVGNLSIQFPTPPSLNVTKILTAANFTFKRNGGRGIVGPAWMARANTPHLAAANRARDVYEAELEAGRDPRLVRREAKVAAAEARGVISSDDPHALAKLRAKLETADSGERTRLKYRIEKLERAAQLGGKSERFGDAELVWNAAENRLQVFFASKPDAATRSSLKGLGLRWAPSVPPAGAWVRGLKDGFADDVQRFLRDRAQRLGMATPKAEGEAAPGPPAPHGNDHEHGHDGDDEGPRCDACGAGPLPRLCAACARIAEGLLELVGNEERSPDRIVGVLVNRNLDEERIRTVLQYLIAAHKLSWVCNTCGAFAAESGPDGDIPEHNALGAHRCTRPLGLLTQQKRPVQPLRGDARALSERSTASSEIPPEVRSAVDRVSEASIPLSDTARELLARFRGPRSAWGPELHDALITERRSMKKNETRRAQMAVSQALEAAAGIAYFLERSPDQPDPSPHLLVNSLAAARRAIKFLEQHEAEQGREEERERGAPRRLPPNGDDSEGNERPALKLHGDRLADADHTPVALRIGLVASAKQQLKGDRKGRARDLYVGPVFRNALRYAEATCDRVFILSPLWGAISPDTVIQTYNQTLDPHRAAGWFQRNRARLVTPRNAKLPVQLVLLTGDTYAAPYLAPGNLPEAWLRPETPLAGMSIGPRMKWLAARVRELDAAGTFFAGKTAPRSAAAPEELDPADEAPESEEPRLKGDVKATPIKREPAEEAHVREARAVAAATVREAVRVVVGAIDEKGEGHETRLDLGLLRRYLGHEADTLLPAAVAHAMRVPREDERTPAADAAAQALEALHALLEASGLRDEARGILGMLERAERHAKQAISFARAVDAQLAHKVKLGGFARGRAATDARAKARDQVLAVVGLVLAEVIDEHQADAETRADRGLLQRFARGGGGVDASLFADVEKRIHLADKHRARTIAEQAIDYSLHAIERLSYGDAWKARLSDHGLGCYEQAEGQAEMGIEAAKRTIKDRGPSAPIANLAARLGLEGDIEAPVPDRITTRADFERAERRIAFLRPAHETARGQAMNLAYRVQTEEPTARKGSKRWAVEHEKWAAVKKLADETRLQEKALKEEIHAISQKQIAFKPGDWELEPPSINPAKVREDYSDRREQRIERLGERAEKTSAQADSTLKHARKLADVIPFGQPIHVGHHSEKGDRNFRARISNTYDKGFALTKAAEDLAQRAAAASENTAISSDDPNAIEALKAKLAKLEQRQERMVASNKALKNARATGEDPTAALMALGHSPESAANILEPDFRKRTGYPRYALTNNGAEIRRMEARIADLTAHRAAPSVEKTIGEVRIHESDNRIKITFPDKPPEEVRAFLKSSGFRWASREGVWQRQSSVLADHLAQQAAAMMPPADVSETHSGPVMAPRDELAHEAAEAPTRAVEPIDPPSPIAQLVAERQKRRAEQTATQLRRAAIVSNLREYVILVLHSDPPDIVSDSGVSARDLLRRFQADEAMTGNLLPYFRRAIQEHWTGRRPGKTDDGIFFLALRAVERALTSWDLDRNDPNLSWLLDDTERLSHQLRDLREARHRGTVRAVTPEPAPGASSRAFDAREDLANAASDHTATAQNRAAREAEVRRTRTTPYVGAKYVAGRELREVATLIRQELAAAGKVKPRAWRPITASTTIDEGLLFGVVCRVSKTDSKDLRIDITKIPEGIEIANPARITRDDSGAYHEVKVPRYTAHAAAILAAVTGIANAYNFDESDLNSDVHRKGFFLTVEFGGNLEQESIESTRLSLAEKAERDARPPPVRGQTSTDPRRKSDPHQATISGQWEPAVRTEKPAPPKVDRAIFRHGDTVCAAKAIEFRGIVIGPEYLRDGKHLVDVRWTNGLPPRGKTGIASASGIPVELLFLVRAFVPHKPVQTSLTTIGGLRLDESSGTQKDLFS